jgi:branched-chain amino acid transport system substrate-binding protein
MKKIKHLVAAAAALVVACAAQAEIKIGVSLPLTGPGSGLGIPMQRQLQAVPQGHWRRAGAPDHPGRRHRPGKGAANARRFVTDEKVDLIFGSSITAVAGAMAPLPPKPDTVRWPDRPVGVPPGKDKWLFRLPQSNTVMGHAVVEHMKKQGVKTVGFLGYTDAYGEQWLEAMSHLAG